MAWNPFMEQWWELWQQCHLAGHIPGSFSGRPASGLTGSWDSGLGHSDTFWQWSQDQSLGGDEWSLPCVNPNCLFPAVPLTQLSRGAFRGHELPALCRWWLCLLPEALLDSWPCPQLPVLSWLSQKLRCEVDLVVCVGLEEWVGRAQWKTLE